MKNTHPDIIRPDSKIALVSKWKVKNPEHQKMAGDAAIDVWKNMPWPDGLISHTAFLGHDNVAVLQYSQWRGEKAVDAFRRNNLEDRADDAHQTVPGLERVEAVMYRHYRSMISEKSAGSQPGCIILVSFEADGPEWQSQFVDTLIDTVESRENPHHPGSIASHFHFSMDGKRVMNYAEFRNKEAHEVVVETMLQSDDKVPKLIRSMPGIKPLGFERFSFHKSITVKQHKIHKNRNI